MARRKRTPDTSSITRSTTAAYARKAKAEPESAKPDEASAAHDANDANDANDAKPGQPARERVDTIAMPLTATLGEPPAMPVAEPAAIPPEPVHAQAAVEDPTQMPGPRAIPAGNPEDRAPAPGHVGPGDSRSLRRAGPGGGEFALIYRRDNALITRFGALGTRGQWRVVEYPTSAFASHAYARECSRFVSEGFSDYRA